MTVYKLLGLHETRQHFLNKGLPSSKLIFLRKTLSKYFIIIHYANKYGASMIHSM